ncbi:uncharacterized protein PAC_19804 [Phialocephala subalpina]|uniref:Uncharacterized protein n=1 Tax=Phialocephala subalpina TaxID=576137 RepID=A0A1L7XY26_9HELO|nr:uncharacterized protein PAC_19804 [Phialocephala subalpina]
MVSGISSQQSEGNEDADRSPNQSQLLANMSTTASITQLLGQTIGIVQKIRTIRATVLKRPRILDQYDSQLDALLRMLTLVQNQKELQTSHIHKQIEEMRIVAGELEASLVGMRKRQSRGKAEQYGREILANSSEEESVNRQIDHLHKAMNQLDTMIALANVGLTGSVAEGLRANLSTIQRVDRNVQQIIYASQTITAGLETTQRSANCENDTPLSRDDLNDFGSIRDNRTYINNLAHDKAVAINSNIGIVASRPNDYRKFEGNSAWNDGVVINGDMDADSFAKLLASRA